MSLLHSRQSSHLMGKPSSSIQPEDFAMVVTRNIPDFTALHENLSLWRPYLYDQSGKHQFLNGASFASAGAPVLSCVNPKVKKFNQVGCIAAIMEISLGNNNFLNVTTEHRANFPPYGETFFKYSTGRFCDGRLIPDFIALHANLSLWRPYLDQPGKHQFLNGANFASAGATVLPYLSPELLHLDIQLGFFKNVVSLWRHELGNAEANKRLNNAVFLISIGGVDYLSFPSDYPNATESEKQEYVNWVIGNITNTITVNFIFFSNQPL
ncbi:hypothetical protein Q3G72_027730 [Acer saccharum]|nr:hypothetical protein Q3G72_027730 [Acer saccharum]